MARSAVTGAAHIRSTSLPEFSKWCILHISGFPWIYGPLKQLAAHNSHPQKGANENKKGEEGRTKRLSFFKFLALCSTSISNEK